MAAAAATGDVDEHREPGRSTEADGRSSTSRVAHGRNRRSLSADSAGVLAAAVAAAARENKRSGNASGVGGEGLRRRASASGTELAEQQQWQEDPQREQLQQPRPQPRPRPQQQEQQEQQQPSPPLPSETVDSRSSPGGADGRDRWRRRGQRLWRQGSGAERGGDNEGRARRVRGGRRRSWGQGWASGRLQGLWGGGSGGGGGTNDTGAGAQGSNQASPPAPSPAAPLPPPPPSTAVVTPADAVVEGEELSWVSLPSGQAGGAVCGPGGGALPTSSPAGRSFHCAFFQGGACYVTGGSDGARKFGDMWRFPVRESPPPLTTLAARAFVSKARNTAATSKAATGESSLRERASHMELLESLPQELRECLSSLNMQAEVVL